MEVRPGIAACVLAFVMILSGCGGGNSGTGKANSGVGPPTIQAQPASQTVITGQPAIFTVKASGTDPLGYQWQKNSSNIDGATSASYSTPATTSADSGAQFTVVISNSISTVTSSSATLTVSGSAPAVDVLTYHNDIARTGQNLNEVILTKTDVSSTTFGKIGFYPTDGLVDAQPLVASGVSIPGQGTHNVLIVASEHGTVFAFDADNGGLLWSATTLAAGETPSDDRGCNQVTPEIGVTSTPVIDRANGNGVVYVVAMSKDASGNYHHRIHALDLTLGNELLGGPTEIQATYPGTGDNSDGTNVIFDPGQYKERVALLELNGVIYTGWASHCDVRPYTGWIIGYNASTLAQTSILNITPNGSSGATWNSGAGFAADSAGNIYIPDGNGTFDTTLDTNGFPIEGDLGNAFLKISTSGGQIAVADYFEMYDQFSKNEGDFDLGSGGGMVLPDFSDGSGQTRHLAVAAGKDGNVYLVNRDSMGKFNPKNNSNIYQELTGVMFHGVFSAPAYFNNKVYFGPVGGPIEAYAMTNAKLPTSATARTSNSFSYPGATPSISANGSNDGILWAVENSSLAVLHAYDATSLAELYNSNQAGNRDQFGDENKFITPTIADGKVFVGTPNGVAVFGILQ